VLKSPLGPGALSEPLSEPKLITNSTNSSLDGKPVASASGDKTVRLWDAATGAARRTLDGHSDIVWDVAFSPDGKLVASASRDKTVRLWDAAIGAAENYPLASS
jgi:WD40 repeat protein